MRRPVRLLATILILGTVIPVARTTPTFADPGFCGVREAGPQLIAGDYSRTGYEVHNKCTGNYAFRVYTPTSHAYTVCRVIQGNTDYLFSSPTADLNWVVRNCISNEKAGPRPSRGANACAVRMVTAAHLDARHVGYVLFDVCLVGDFFKIRFGAPYNSIGSCAFVAAHGYGFLADSRATTSWSIITVPACQLPMHVLGHLG